MSGKNSAPRDPFPARGTDMRLRGATLRMVSTSSMELDAVMTRVVASVVLHLEIAQGP